MREHILVTPRSLTMEPYAHVERLRELGWEIVYAFNTVEPETIDSAAVAATSPCILRSEPGTQVRKRPRHERGR